MIDVAHHRFAIAIVGALVFAAALLPLATPPSAWATDPTSTVVVPTTTPTTAPTTAPPSPTTTPGATVPDATTTTTGPSAPGDAVTPPVTLPSQNVDALRSLSQDYEDASAEEVALFQKYLTVAQTAIDLGAKVDDLNRKVTVGQAELSSAQATVDRADHRAQDLGRQLDAATVELDHEQQRLRAQAVQAYIGGGLHGDEGPVDALARAGSMNDLGTTLVYAGVVVSDRRAVVQRVTELRAEVARLETEARAAVDAASRARDDVATRQAALQGQRDQATDLQRAVNEQAVQNQQLLAEVAAKRAVFSERIAALAQVSDTIAMALNAREKGQVLPVLTAGIFLSPIPSPRFNSPFGPRVDPVFGTTSMHNGVDINGTTGTPIRAAADGVVVIAGDVSGYGNCTVIDHGSGLGTLYGHQSQLLVTVGQPVKRGDVIGLVGSTGKSTGPHLHWEVRRFGQPIDPVAFIGPG